jgi:hypothetical protein
MGARAMLKRGVAGLLAATIVGLAGCEGMGGGGGEPRPTNTGAGIPRKGPIGPPKGQPKGAAGKMPATPKGASESGGGTAAPAANP